jgi:hypothetical protein
LLATYAAPSMAFHSVDSVLTDPCPLDWSLVELWHAEYFGDGWIIKPNGHGFHRELWSLYPNPNPQRKHVQRIVEIVKMQNEIEELEGSKSATNRFGPMSIQTSLANLKNCYLVLSKQTRLY